MKGNQFQFIDYVLSKGYDYETEMFAIYSDFLLKFTSYESASHYVFKTAQNEIENATGPGTHYLLEPVILPSIMNAMFIAMYGDFEGFLTLICKEYGKENLYTVKLKDLVGNGVEKAGNYLDKVVGRQNVKTSSEWKQLQDWNRVRNILVHNNGVIRDEKDRTSIKFLNLNINTEDNKVYLLYRDCEKFSNLCFDLIKLCI